MDSASANRLNFSSVEMSGAALPARTATPTKTARCRQCLGLTLRFAKGRPASTAARSPRHHGAVSDRLLGGSGAWI